MEYKTRNVDSVAISPGTIGVAQKISSGNTRFSEENRNLVFLAKNDIITCGHNQY